VTALPPASEPGQPLPVMVDVKSAVAVVVHADPDTGLLVIRPAAWPWCRIMVAPEVALELALHLVSRVADLSRRR
jgi:hypothetical protein